MKGSAGASRAADGVTAAEAARFAAALDRLWPEGGRLGLAVSGGPDSLALLLLAHAAVPGRFAVASVDHGLRPAAAEECRAVARVCAERGILCAILTVQTGTGNLQTAAREARYAALAGWAEREGLGALATAHHADDQAETLIMRLNRASGLSGLAGVRRRGVVPGTALPLLRPLLDWRRAELAEIVSRAGLEPAADPSNRDERFDRVRIRAALATADWLDPPALAQSAAHLAEADAALEWAAEREWAERVVTAADRVRYNPSAPRVIVLRVVARIIAHFGGEGRGAAVAQLVDGLAAGRTGNLGGVMASVEKDAWLFRPEPPRRSF
ncbi:tRNA lysidine(34) synthetase TilS [Altererythrobacter soli]|uniref:tRNA(Ile)-lysidine synthase n=1 Tax=Croceibacterium soli TaxID=1739690 RepID=A0A6I4UT38_9SPHN|nr:tRNA lysidine(34) synthetase TilS [Croceibacterium soli]MXP41818.1 tRNA lysidine(34) synthetase TilS [Croceibacterium soli]